MVCAFKGNAEKLQRLGQTGLVLQAIDGGQERLDVDVSRAERVLYLLAFTLALEHTPVIIAIAGPHTLLGLEARA